MTIEDRVRFGGGASGIERAEIGMRREAYSPHRHDTYTLGITLAGVQTFHYRGAGRASVPGKVFVLHPDELHDGGPGTETGLGYRALYVAPGLVARAVDRLPLPFVKEPICSDPRLVAAISAAFDDFDAALDEHAALDLVTALAEALAQAGGEDRRPRSRVDRRAMQRVASLIDAAPEKDCRIETLERISGHDRWTLYRQFRTVHGVSPYRYAKMRRLDRARALIRAGHSLAEAALEAGFSDQSHLTRQFKETYGFAPGRWRRMIATG